MIRLQVKLAGRPLRHTFVSYTPTFSEPEIRLTDDDGYVRFDLRPTARIDLVVHAQNVAVRMLDARYPGVSEPTRTFRDRGDGDVCQIRSNEKAFDHFAVMDRCYEVYETVFRPHLPFRSASRRAFPFGGHQLEPHELKRAVEIDCRFPESKISGRLPWVQPQSLMTGVPLMHLKAQGVDARLFGTDEKAATSIPHEFAHAVHFAELPKLGRLKMAFDYGKWIVAELAKGNSATHRTNKSTNSMVAFVESFGLFSQRYFLYATEVEPDLSGAALHRAFIDDELSAQPALREVIGRSYRDVASRRSDGKIRPKLTSNKVEGAVYGAVFLDFASRTNLSTAVNYYLRCRGFDFGDYRGYVRKQRDGRLRSDIDAVSQTWGM